MRFLDDNEIKLVEFTKIYVDKGLKRFITSINHDDCLHLINKLSTLITPEHTLPHDCEHCSAWEFVSHEADGQKTGKCTRHSRDKWKYDKILIENTDIFEMYTKDSFYCSEFGRKK